MKRYLGIELGSTRIKAMTVDSSYRPISSGAYSWRSSICGGLWSYDLDEALLGLKAALSELGCTDDISCMGISAMMHGYLAFDSDWKLLVPFRTWQNTNTGRAAGELSALFGCNIPLRWSIAHLYEAILCGEEHIGRIAHLTTLSGYIHHLLTGENVLGIGDASGMFPIDSRSLDYDEELLRRFDVLTPDKGFCLRDVLPRVLVAGSKAGRLTDEGAALLGGMIPSGTPFAPPEGDAGTGMTATNSVMPRCGNISAGTSIFSMIVLDRPLDAPHSEIDMVTTPAGAPVAMIHCNNCTGDMNHWVALLGETAEIFGASPDTAELYTKLYEESLKGDADCGGVVVCNYLAGESIVGLERGIPFVLRRPECSFTLANFMRAQLYSSLASLRLGMDILAKENVIIDGLVGHGGLFKVPGVGQRYTASALGLPVTVMEASGEGGAYGMAILAAYADCGDGDTLELYLERRVFATSEKLTVLPDKESALGFERYLELYRAALSVERTAVMNILN